MSPTEIFRKKPRNKEQAAKIMQIQANALDTCIQTVELCDGQLLECLRQTPEADIDDQHAIEQDYHEALWRLKEAAKRLRKLAK